MPTWLKVTLIGVAASIAVVAALVGGGYFWWQSNRDALVEEARAAQAEGVRFAAGKDQQACLDEAITRVKGGEMIIGPVKAQVFLTSCLVAARPAAGFCDGVPGPDDMLKSISWNQQRASDYGLGSFQAPFIIQTIQHLCTSGALK